MNTDVWSPPVSVGQPVRRRGTDVMHEVLALGARYLRLRHVGTHSEFRVSRTRFFAEYEPWEPVHVDA